MLPVFSSRCESVLGRAHRLDLWWPYSWSGQNEIHWVSGKDRRWRRPRGWPHRQAGQTLLLQIWPKNKSMRTEDIGNEMKLAKVRLPGTFLEKKKIVPGSHCFKLNWAFLCLNCRFRFVLWFRPGTESKLSKCHMAYLVSQESRQLNQLNAVFAALNSLVGHASWVLRDRHPDLVQSGLLAFWTAVKLLRQCLSCCNQLYGDDQVNSTMRPTTSGWTAFCLKFLKISRRQKSGYQAGSRLWICLSSQTDWSMIFDDFLSMSFFTLFQLFHLFVQVFDPNPSVWKCDPAALFLFFFCNGAARANFPWNFPGSKKSQIKSFPFSSRKGWTCFWFSIPWRFNYLYHFTPLFSFVLFDMIIFYVKHVCGILYIDTCGPRFSTT